MLKDYEIKALEHDLLDYNAWAAHAVQEGCFPDTETALKYKAKKCAERMIKEHECISNTIIATTKDNLLAAEEADVQIKRDEFKNELNTKSIYIENINNEITALKEAIKEKEFLKKVARVANNQETETELNEELVQLNSELEDKTTTRNNTKNTLDDFLNSKRLEVETLLSGILVISDQIIEEKINICHAASGYKNRAQREGA
jgi:hypothetical protein